MLFASHGAPSRRVLDAKTQTPFYLHPKQRVGIKQHSDSGLSLPLTRGGFDNVVARICSLRPGEISTFSWTTGLRLGVTSWHPSAVQAVLTELAQSSVGIPVYYPCWLFNLIASELRALSQRFSGNITHRCTELSTERRISSSNDQTPPILMWSPHGWFPEGSSRSRWFLAGSRAIIAFYATSG